MDKMKLTERQSQLIERIGVYMEQNGLQPAPARILALLLVAEQTELTFDEIRTMLHISKSATSNAINLLLRTKQIEYITHLGERKRYFRTQVLRWKDQLKENLQGIIEFRTLLEEVLALRSEKAKTNPEFNDNFEEIIDFLNYLHKEFDDIFKKWEAKRA